MGDFGHRVTDTLLSSDFLPVRFRTRLMRAVGYDIDPSACSWAGAILRSKKAKTGINVFINIGFVTILPSVTVASGCVIAASAVVTRQTQPNGLYAGTPARVVRTLSSFAGSVCPEPVC